jgi:thymidylate synthase
MKQYLELMNDVLKNSVRKTDRTGTGTFSVFGRMMRFDLAKGFPLLTTKKVHFKSVVHELLWFLMGTDDTSYLEENKVSIWREWQTELIDPDGRRYPSIGPLYGKNWLYFKGSDGREFNQIDSVIEQIKTRPDSRRMVVSAWNPEHLPDPSLSPQENVRLGKGALAPCHAFFQFAVQDGKLSCMLTQRSADLFLGVPFNIASYSLLTMMIAQQTHLELGEFIWSGGDVHIYKNHLEQVELQRSRVPRPLPKLRIKRRPASIYEYHFDDFELLDYDPMPAIKAQVSI